MQFQIVRLSPNEDGTTTREDVELFTEGPAAEVGTLGGRLLALSAETGFEHVATPVAEKA